MPAEGEVVAVEGENVEGAEAAQTKTTSSVDLPIDDGTVVVKKKLYEALFPDPFLTKTQIQQGGFIIYFLGIMYMFQGISLVTQNYINPAIDTIKKKGILGSDTMNATLLAFSNSAAESFIVVNSIFFGVPDIGI